jgi:AcrR family transcriptional regulator
LSGGRATKEKILDAAEELFSEEGFSATSVRAITSRAQVNLAALNYHFGSKDALIDAVFERRTGLLNRERLRLLEEAEALAGEGELTLEEVLRAFLTPAIRLACDHESGGMKFMRLMGRAHSESREFFRERIARQFGGIFQRFNIVFRRLLPDLPPEELFWRMHFVVGAMAHTMAHTLTLRDLVEAFSVKDLKPPSKEITGKDADEVLSRLIRFAAAGLRSEVPRLQEVGPR